MALFKSKEDVEVLDSLSHAVGLPQLEAKARADAELDGEDPSKIKLSLVVARCSHPALVLEHLESHNTYMLGNIFPGAADLPMCRNSTVLGLLLKVYEWQLHAESPRTLAAIKYCNANPDDGPVVNETIAMMEEYQGIMRHLHLLSACAMALGANVFPDARQMKMIRKQCITPIWSPATVAQMQKACDPTAGFKLGIPWDFETGRAKAGYEEQYQEAVLNPKPDPSTIDDGSQFIEDMVKSSARMVSLMVHPPSVRSARDQTQRPPPADVCGKCGKDERRAGHQLMVCSRCQTRKYCSKDCQTAHWKLHKIECKEADQQKEGKDPSTEKEGKQPGTKKEGKQPAAEKQGKRPEPKKDGKRPEPKKEGTAPTTKKENKPPLTKKEGKQPETKTDGKEAGHKNDGKEPDSKKAEMPIRKKKGKNSTHKTPGEEPEKTTQ